MKWNRAVPEKLYFVGCESSKEVLIHAFWLAVSKGCLNNQEEALDLCLTYINEARKDDGQRPILRETIERVVAERKAARAEIALRRIP